MSTISFTSPRPMPSMRAPALKPASTSQNAAPPAAAPIRLSARGMSSSSTAASGAASAPDRVMTSGR